MSDFWDLFIGLIFFGAGLSLITQCDSSATAIIGFALLGISYAHSWRARKAKEK